MTLSDADVSYLALHDQQFASYAILYGVEAARKKWSEKIRCSECGEFFAVADIEWAEYCFMDSDEVVAMMPVCKPCIAKIEAEEDE